MRRVFFLGLPLVALLCGGLGWYVVVHRGNLLEDAQQRLARGDLHGAQIDLNTFLRQNPGNPQAEFRLGLVNIGLDNQVAAARELHLARDHGYDPRAVVLPLGQTYLKQHLYDQALVDFDADRAASGARAATLAVRAQIFLALNRIDEAAAAADAAEAAGPGELAPRIAAAHVALARNDLAGAAAKAAAAAALDPRNTEALLLQSDIALHRADAKSALALALSALSASPGSTDAQMAAARAYAALGDPDHAIPLLDQVSRVEKHSSAPRFLRAILAARAHDFATADANLLALSGVIDDLPQGNYYLGVTKLGLGQVDQAQEAAAKYHARVPNDPDGTKLLAMTQIALHQPQAAQALLTGLVAAGHAEPETLDLLGRAQTLAGDLKAAKESFTRASAANPADVDILNRRAAVELRLGEDTGAVADLRHSLDLRPGQDDAGVTLVQAALAHGDIGAAGDAVSRLRNAHGETPIVGMLNATVLAAGQDLRGAETAYRAVLARYPETAENEPALRQTTLGLVQVLGRLSDVAGVQAALSGWTDRHPKDLEALGLLLKLLFADGKPDLAVAAASAAHQAAPADPGLTEMLARAYIADRKLDRAIALLDRAGAGTDPKLAGLRAEALVMAGERDAARTAYANLLQLAPGDLAARLGLVRLDTQTGHEDEARRLLKDGLFQHPGDARLMQALVGMDLKSGGLTVALATAETLAADPQNLPAARILRADAYAAAGDPDRAATAAAAAYKDAPSGDLAMAAWTALNHAGRRQDGEKLLANWGAAHPEDAGAQQVLGALALADHRPDAAALHLQAVLTQRPNDAAALNNMAWVALARGDTAQARANAQRAYFIQPGPQTADTLGWTMAKQGDTAQAMPLLRQAVGADATPGLGYHYAYALNAAGQRDQAKALLQKVLAEPQPFDERDDARRLLDALTK